MPAPPITTDEYFRTPETMLPQELVYGTVRDAPAPAPGHQTAVGLFFIALFLHAHERHAGGVWLSPIDVVLDREGSLVVQPDVIFVREERLHIVTDRVWGAPDLVVEVLSPNPRIGTLEERLDWFARHGVREWWLVRQPLRELEVLQLADGSVAGRHVCRGDRPIRSRVLPDFTRSVSSILDWW
jgi:Uma2 family endonuclease